MSRVVKGFVSGVVWLMDRGGCLLRRMTGRGPRPRLVILYYHAVPRAQAAAFASQMDLLSRIASPAEADAEPPDLKPGLNAAVTFDDAFESVTETALPLLEERGIPCVVFAPAAKLGRAPDWEMPPGHPDRGERVMDAAGLKALAGAPGVRVGSHTLTHPRLTRLGPAALHREVFDSRRLLEKALGRSVTLLSLPHGAYDDAVLEAAREAGYARVFTIEPRLASARPGEWLTGRFSVSPLDTRLEFRLKLEGAYRWVATASSWKKKITSLGRRGMKGKIWKEKALEPS